MKKRMKQPVPKSTLKLGRANRLTKASFLGIQPELVPERYFVTGG